MVAEVAPLPAWCVDVLLSPDLLPVLFASLGLAECAAASVCSAWAAAYARHLRRCGFICPRIARSLTLPRPNGLCMLTGGVLAAVCAEGFQRVRVRFVAAREDHDRLQLAACGEFALANATLGWTMGIAQTNDGIIVCIYESDSEGKLLKYGPSGVVAEVAPPDGYALGLQTIVTCKRQLDK